MQEGCITSIKCGSINFDDDSDLLQSGPNPNLDASFACASTADAGPNVRYEQLRK